MFALRAVVTAVFVLFAQNAFSNSACGDPRPFVSDGCSSPMKPGQYDHVTGASYVKCCYAHDISYYKGGSEDDRWAADMTFAKCVMSNICISGKSKKTKQVCETEAGEQFKKFSIKDRFWDQVFGSHEARTAIGMVRSVRTFGDASGRQNDWEWGYGWSEKGNMNKECRRSPNLSSSVLNAELKKAQRMAEQTDQEIASHILNEYRDKKFSFPFQRDALTKVAGGGDGKKRSTPNGRQ